MSGIFFIVQETLRGPDASLLQPTCGGYPHITFLYSGRNIELDELISSARSVFGDYAQTSDGKMRTVQLSADDAKINSFVENRNGVKRERHDVLLHLSDKDARAINELRSTFVSDQRIIAMREPHITHSVHYGDKAAAKAALAALQPHFPIEVAITGVAID